MTQILCATDKPAIRNELPQRTRLASLRTKALHYQRILPNLSHPYRDEDTNRRKHETVGTKKALTLQFSLIVRSVNDCPEPAAVSEHGGLQLPVVVGSEGSTRK